MMAQSRYPEADEQGIVLLDKASEPSRETLKHLIIGSPKAVKSTINSLQVLGYAQVSDWSQLIPTANPGEVMSILSRNIMVQ
ncbi:hypothetical protein NIES4071_09680 [Calothrix sp. NIES-4071]|nr:hypothetical protein NIES4071_09680 [Calothrix sp. NIES-4071]BAZ55310.1 hypothetical protein NIES4105_09640 [Calothrix sp. NIES-4105]